MNREKKSIEAQTLRAKGNTYESIAYKLGVSLTAAYGLVNPDKYKDCLERNRLRRRSLKCPQCDKTMQFASTTCKSCQKIWDKDKIIAAIKMYFSENGKTPTAKCWRKSGTGVYPTSATVHSTFGSWNAAIEAAGFETRQSRNPHYRKNDK